MTAVPSTVPRTDCPRPQFTRPDWLPLNGWWEFEQDPLDEGLDQGWDHDRLRAERILVSRILVSRILVSRILVSRILVSRILVSRILV